MWDGGSSSFADPPLQCAGRMPPPWCSSDNSWKALNPLSSLRNERGGCLNGSFMWGTPLGWWQEALTLGKAPERRVCSRLHHRRGVGEPPVAPPWKPRALTCSPQCLCFSRASHHCGHAPTSSPRLGCSLCQASSFSSLDGERRQWENHLDPDDYMPSMPKEVRTAPPEQTQRGLL